MLVCILLTGGTSNLLPPNLLIGNEYPGIAEVAGKDAKKPWKKSDQVSGLARIQVVSGQEGHGLSEKFVTYVEHFTGQLC